MTDTLKVYSHEVVSGQINKYVC